MANQFLDLQIPLTGSLKNHMQGLCRGIILEPTNQYSGTRFLKNHTCHERVVFLAFSHQVVVWF